MSLLARIRNKPKAVRKQIAFSGALAATSVIAIVWLSTLPERYQTVSVEEVVEESSEATGGLRSFFAGVREQVAAVSSVWQGEESAETEGTATSTPSITPVDAPQIVIPQLQPTDINTLNPRPIQIATSSAE